MRTWICASAICAISTWFPQNVSRFAGLGFILRKMLATFLLTSAALTTRHVLPNGDFVTITSSGKPSQNARVWSCAVPVFFSTGKYVTSNETGAAFSDPDGKTSGTGSWSGLKRSFYEGEKVKVSLSCSNLSLSFFAENCADGKTFFSRGVRHPWNPDRSSQTFEFTFQPTPGRTRVVIRIEASSSLPGRFSGYRANSSWILTPGKAVEAPKPTSLTAADAQVVSAAYLLRGSLVQHIPDVSPLLKDAPVPTGIAADGVSLLVLRAPASKAGTATFSVGGAGGALYPLEGQVPLKSKGATSVNVQTHQSNGKHYALALYRPPTYFGNGTTSKPLDFKVKFAGGSEASLSMRLVPPPVVLVHGTYDNPKFCYEDHADEDDTQTNLAPMLRSRGYDVTTVDWEETNGNKDPSEFQHNRMTVYKNAGGIKDALEATRRKGIIVTQADVICHSQGGAIARTYARGYPFSTSLPPTHPHYTDPAKCRAGEELCWYHRADNNFTGDIHRLITISTTHRGSHVLNVFKGLATYPDKTADEIIEKAMVSTFLYGVDKGISGITTGGVLNQIPDSLELQLIGPTPIPAHAIACVASNEDLRNQRPDSNSEHEFGSVVGLGKYWNKLRKICLGTSTDARDFLFLKLCKLAGENGMPDPDGELARYRYLVSKVRVDENGTNDRMDALIYQMRKIVFQGLENDCTVSIKSSFGGLADPYRTRVPNVLHGWAPRYRAIQLRVLKLLVSDGTDFDYNGFPGYSGVKSKAASFAEVIPPLTPGQPISDADIPSNPNVKVPTKATPETKTESLPRVGPIGKFDLSPERLSSPANWRDSSALGGTAKFEGGRLHLASPNKREAEATTFLKSPLRGDFDLVFDYRLESWRAKGEGQVKWDVLLSPSTRTVGEDYLVFGRRTSAEGETVAVEPWKNIAGDEAKAATTGGGKLRVTRKGAAWNVFQWDGKAWKAVLTFDSADHPEVYVGFRLSVGGDGDNAKVSVQISGGPGS